MDVEARRYLLKKIATQGFSIEDNGDKMVLRPRGSVDTTALTIEEVESDTWKVVEAVGKYAGFARGYKRTYFENQLNSWVIESRLRSL